MYSKEDILARLRKGENMDAILDEMTDALQQADKLYQEELEAKKAEEAKRQDKRDDMRDVAAALAYYLHLYTDCEANIINSLRDPSDKELDQWCAQAESLVKVMLKMKELENLEFITPKNLEDWFW